MGTGQIYHRSTSEIFIFINAQPPSPGTGMVSIATKLKRDVFSRLSRDWFTILLNSEAGYCAPAAKSSSRCTICSFVLSFPVISTDATCTYCEEVSVCACRLIVLIPGKNTSNNAVNACANDVRCAPVSYTHLDVYKRQLHIRGEPLCRNK